MKLTKPHLMTNDCCTKRNEQGYSLATVMALCGVVSIAVAGAYAYLLPSYNKVQHLKYDAIVRSAAESCADYVVQDINTNFGAGQTSTFDGASELQNTSNTNDGGSTVTLVPGGSGNGKYTVMPSSVVPSSNGIQPTVTVTVWNVNPPRPALGQTVSNCAYWDKWKDYLSEAPLPHQNYYRVVQTTATLGSLTRNVRVVLMPNFTTNGTTPLFGAGPYQSAYLTFLTGFTGTDSYNGTNGVYNQNTNKMYQGNVVSNGYVQLGQSKVASGTAPASSGTATIGGNLVSYGTGTVTVTANTTSLGAALGGTSIANDPTTTSTITVTGNYIGTGSVVQGTVSTAGSFLSGGTPSYIYSGNSTSTGNVQDLPVLQAFNNNQGPAPPATTAGTITGAPATGAVAGTSYTVDTTSGATITALPPVPSAPSTMTPVNPSAPLSFPNVANTSVQTIQVSNGGMVFVANGATAPTSALIVSGSGGSGGNFGYGGQHGSSTSVSSATIPPGPYQTGSIYTVGGSDNVSSPSGFPSNLNRDPVTGQSVDGSGIVIASNVTTPLQFYVQGSSSGTSAIVIADGGLTNLTNNPAMAQIYYSGSKGVWLGDSDGNTTQQFVIYAPNAPIQIDAIGQGMSNSGAVVGASVSVTGGTNGHPAMMHWDSRLANPATGAPVGSGASNSYVIGSLSCISWQEF